MIAGLGCDIVKISRIAELLASYGRKFEKKVFVAREIEGAPDNSAAAAYYAKRFAAKEAFAKAVGTGINSNLGFLDIEVIKDASGAPRILSKKFPMYNALLSLSDEKEFAIACVIIFLKKKPTAEEMIPLAEEAPNKDELRGLC